MGLRELLHDLPAFLSPRTPMVLRGMQEVERRHPHEPHYYLSMLGVDPPAQRHGMGSALLGPMLARCDEEGVGAYLETGDGAQRLLLLAPRIPRVGSGRR